MTVEIYRASQRFTDRAPGRMTWHSFSFGAHYDPARVGFGPMTCHDEHLLGDGQGFETHRHAAVEIVTWVVAGALRHTDSTGDTHELRPGEVGLLSAGAGVEHSEIASAPGTRFVQVWLAAADPDRPPHYTATPSALASDGFSIVAEPQPGAAFAVARLDPDQTVTVPAATRRHLYVARGALRRSSLAEPLQAGDAFLLAPGDEADSAAFDVTAAVPTELLLWSFA